MSGALIIRILLNYQADESNSSGRRVEGGRERNGMGGRSCLLLLVAHRGGTCMIWGTDEIPRGSRFSISRKP